MNDIKVFDMMEVRESTRMGAERIHIPKKESDDEEVSIKDDG